MINAEQILLLAGVNLGCFFVILLLTAPRYRSLANQILAAALSIFVILTLRLSGLVESYYLDELFEFLRLEYLFPVLLYLYVITCLGEKWKIRAYWPLLLPFFLMSLQHTLISLADWYDYELLAHCLEAFEPYELLATIGFSATVVVMSVIRVYRSKIVLAAKKWIYVNSSILLLLMGSWLILDLLEILFRLDYWIWLWVGMSGYLMGVTYLGVQHLLVLPSHLPRNNQSEKRASNSHHSPGRMATQHFERICDLMSEQQLFKNPNLNREILATSLGLSVSSITRILKAYGDVSFTEFVDQYRISLAKTMLSDQQFHIFSLEAIGKEVGFKSRSNFYATFKKITGETPGAFKKKAVLSCGLANPSIQDRKSLVKTEIRYQ